MKTALANSKCPCGENMKAHVKKPKAFQPSVTKITCKRCESKFLLITRIARNDQTGVRIATSHFEILELTELAKGILLPQGQNSNCEITTRPGADGPSEETGALRAS